MINKKGSVESVILIGGILFLVLILGVALAFGGVVVNWVFDEATPTLTTLGMVDNTNLSEIAGYTITPVNSFVQSFSWLSGVIYAFALIGCLGLAFAFRITGNKWLMAFFAVMMLLLVITAIFMSNIYEDFYDDGGSIGTALHELTLLSWLILYSPMVMCVIGFISGIIMFTGEGGEKEEAL